MQANNLQACWCPYGFFYSMNTNGSHCLFWICLLRRSQNLLYLPNKQKFTLSIQIKGITIPSFSWRHQWLTWLTGIWWTPRSQRIPAQDSRSFPFPWLRTSWWCWDGKVSAVRSPHDGHFYGQTLGPAALSLARPLQPPGNMKMTIAIICRHEIAKSDNRGS